MNTTKVQLNAPATALSTQKISINKQSVNAGNSFLAFANQLKQDERYEEAKTRQNEIDTNVKYEKWLNQQKKVNYLTIQNAYQKDLKQLETIEDPKVYKEELTKLEQKAADMFNSGVDSELAGKFMANMENTINQKYYNKYMEYATDQLTKVIQDNPESIKTGKLLEKTYQEMFKSAPDIRAKVAISKALLQVKDATRSDDLLNQDRQDTHTLEMAKQQWNLTSDLIEAKKTKYLKKGQEYYNTLAEQNPNILTPTGTYYDLESKNKAIKFLKDQVLNGEVDADTILNAIKNIKYIDPRTGKTSKIDDNEIQQTATELGIDLTTDQEIKKQQDKKTLAQNKEAESYAPRTMAVFSHLVSDKIPDRLVKGVQRNDTDILIDLNSKTPTANEMRVLKEKEPVMYKNMLDDGTIKFDENGKMVLDRNKAYAHFNRENGDWSTKEVKKTKVIPTITGEETIFVTNTNKAKGGRYGSYQTTRIPSVNKNAINAFVNNSVEVGANKIHLNFDPEDVNSLNKQLKETIWDNKQYSDKVKIKSTLNIVDTIINRTFKQLENNPDKFNKAIFDGVKDQILGVIKWDDLNMPENKKNLMQQAIKNRINKLKDKLNLNISNISNLSVKVNGKDYKVVYDKDIDGYKYNLHGSNALDKSKEVIKVLEAYTKRFSEGKKGEFLSTSNKLKVTAKKLQDALYSGWFSKSIDKDKATNFYNYLIKNDLLQGNKLYLNWKSLDKLNKYLNKK